MHAQHQMHTASKAFICQTRGLTHIRCCQKFVHFFASLRLGCANGWQMLAASLSSSPKRKQSFDTILMMTGIVSLFNTLVAKQCGQHVHYRHLGAELTRVGTWLHTHKRARKWLHIVVALAVAEVQKPE